MRLLVLGISRMMRLLLLRVMLLSRLLGLLVLLLYSLLLLLLLLLMLLNGLLGLLLLLLLVMLLLLRVARMPAQCLLRRMLRMLLRMMLRMMLLMREDGIVGDGLVHGAREEHRRRVRLRLDLLPRRSSPLARHVDGVWRMDIGRPRRGARDGCVDRGGRVEEVLVLGIRALRRLLRIGLRLVRRGGLGGRRLLVRLVCVRRGEGAASEAGLRETQAMRVGPGRAQAGHDGLAMASSRDAAKLWRGESRTRNRTNRRRQGVSRRQPPVAAFGSVDRDGRRRTLAASAADSVYRRLVLLSRQNPEIWFFVFCSDEQTRNPGSGVSLMGLAEACKAWRCALGRRCGQNDEGEKK